MQHIIATNVIRSFTFGTAVVKHLKKVMMMHKSLNVIRASNCNHPFAQSCHFTTMTRIHQGFALLFKLVPLLSKACWDYQSQN